MMMVRQTLRLARIKQIFVIRFDCSSDLSLVLPNPIRIAGGRPMAHMSFGTQVRWSFGTQVNWRIVGMIRLCQAFNPPLD